jgi:hypothetical protein
MIPFITSFIDLKIAFFDAVKIPWNNFWILLRGIPFAHKFNATYLHVFRLHL